MLNTFIEARLYRGNIRKGKGTVLNNDSMPVITGSTGNVSLWFGELVRGQTVQVKMDTDAATKLAHSILDEVARQKRLAQ